MPMTNDDAQEATGPLKGIRVIEMGQLLAGPFCGQLMGDFGAEVIKVEQPGIGDPMREWGQEKPHGLSLWWPVIARNKKSVTLNLRESQGQDIIRKLVEKSDILIENFRPGTLEKWGLGYDELKKINPGLIMVRVSGYGQDGPYSHLPGYGSIGEAMGGLRYVVGDPSTPPSRMGMSIGDELAATFACMGALAALHYRNQTGEGQMIDSAIYEAVLAMMESLIPEYVEGGYIRERSGAILPNVAPSNVYPAKDGSFVLIAANQDTVFKRLAAAMGQPELAEDAHYKGHSARGKHQKELDDIIASWSRTLNADQLSKVLNEFGIPQGKIYRAPDMLADKHFKAREAIIKVAHPQFRDLKMQNVFPKFSKTPGKVRWPGPTLGQHNREIYQDLLHFKIEELKELSERNII
ncbi:L-carnitine dehydratase/bile acid-inducible protein F [hydrothermal vent metagenome]|uniref:L-carnitine dehydratase/bile acid-inducible protein F n=1 Tax=hydrothermal vent metagenome TaxID=652676 RepID=A0A3B0RYX1_9ZZZZ